MFKKQNSLLKKNFNNLANLHPIFFKKNNFFKNIKNLAANTKSNSTFSIKNLTSLNHTVLPSLVNLNKFGAQAINSFHGKKKLKKIIFLNRKVYNNLYNNTFLKAKRLNENITTTSKLSISQILLNFEFMLFNIILSSNLVKSFSDLKLLMFKNNIFLNRTLVKNLNTQINSKGSYSIIEINISNKFFNYLNYCTTTLASSLFKLKSKLWYKTRFRSNHNKKNAFNNSLLLNKLAVSNTLFKSKIPNYMEVDFVTLTIAVVSKQFDLKNMNINVKKFLVLYFFRLYNWK